MIANSYPGYVIGVSMENNLIFLLLSDGEKCLYDDNLQKSFDEKLDHPDLKDTLDLSYPLGNPTDNMSPNHDPGRFRSLSLLGAVYGKTEKQVLSALVSANFCGTNVRFNKNNGAADALKKVGEELTSLMKTRPDLKKYVTNIGGTFAWRTIAGTARPSPHSFGIAIDLNTRHSSYWRGQSEKRLREFSRLDYPVEIIEAFEKNGFVWGGKWYHHDTMHFEFRPEIIAKAKRTGAGMSQWKYPRN